MVPLKHFRVFINIFKKYNSLLLFIHFFFYLKLKKSVVMLQLDYEENVQEERTFNVVCSEWCSESSDEDFGDQSVRDQTGVDVGGPTAT